MGKNKTIVQEEKEKISKKYLLGSVVLAALLSSTITTIAAVVVQWNLLSEQRAETINANIEEVYLINGLDLVVSDLSRYGTVCVVTLDCM